MVVIDVVILSTNTIVGILNGSIIANLVPNKENPEDRVGVSVV